MKKKLEMTEQQAIQEYPTASTAIKAILETSFGKDFFKPKDIKDGISNFKSVLNILGIDESERPYKIPTNPLQRSLNAQWRASKVAEAYNEGHVFNWNDSNEYKYFIYSDLSGDSRGLDVGSWNYYVYYSAGLAFKNRTDALDAIAKFPDIYNDFFMVK